jgi:hypothetical protein
MQKAKRALDALDRIIFALRREYFGFTSTDCALMADDLAYARDVFAGIVLKRSAAKTERSKISDIHAVMQEDMRRK